MDAWRDLADTVAERAVAIGHPADGRAAAVAEQSELRPVEPGPIGVEMAIREVVDRLSDADERVATGSSSSARSISCRRTS